MDIELLDEAEPSSALAGDACASPSARIDLEAITASAELAEQRKAWNRLAGEAVFCRHEWLATWWRHFQTSKTTLTAVAFRDERRELVGIMPWYLDRSWQGRVLRLLGSGIVCSDYVSLLTSTADVVDLARRLANWLETDFRNQWDAVDFDQVDPCDPALAALVAELQLRGHTVCQRPGMHCWRIALPESWDAYLACLSKKRREIARKLWRRWYETGKAKLHRAETPDELENAWRIFIDLHQRRRSSLGQPGCFASPRFESFLHDASRQMLAAGRLQLTYLEIEGQPAATELDLLGGQTVYGYQMGMNPDLAAIQPGNIRLVGLLHAAIASGYRTFDLLRGDEPYKAHWQGRPLPLVRWRIANRSLASRCRHRVWLGAEAARLRVKQALARHSEHQHEPRPAGKPDAGAPATTSETLPAA